MNAITALRSIVKDPAQLKQELAIWMQNCRWAGLSGAQYSRDYVLDIELCKVFSLGTPPKPFLLLGIIVTMEKIPDARYFCLIFTITKQKTTSNDLFTIPPSMIFTPSIIKKQWVLQFATLDPIFIRTLLRLTRQTSIFQTTNFSLDYEPTNASSSSDYFIQEFTILGGGDTTNSIIDVKLQTPNGPQRHVFKYFLRLQQHNMEAEMMVYLHSVGFAASPPLEGILTLKWEGRGVFTVVLVSKFVENDGDGGKPFWNHLQEYLQITQTQKFVKSIYYKIGPLARSIGQTTREFHDALIQTRTGKFQPFTIDSNDIAKWTQELKEKFANAMQLWNERYNFVAPNLVPELLQKVSYELSRLYTHLGWDFLLSKDLLTYKQPIHGDLHLAQFLYQPGPPPRFIITDLEGDPQLPQEKREESRPTWFDLGSLLRALDYIAYFGTWELLKQQIQEHLWTKEDIFTLFLARLLSLPLPSPLEQYRWVGEATVAHALEWVEFVGTQILRGYGLAIHFWDVLPLTFRFMRATSELNYELIYRGQNALVPLLGVITLGNQLLQFKK